MSICIKEHHVNVIRRILDTFVNTKPTDQYFKLMMRYS